MVAAPTRNSMRAAVSECSISRRSLRCPPSTSATTAGSGAENVPERADLSRHGVLLTESRSQTTLGASDEKRAHRQQRHRGKQVAVGSRRECEGEIKAGADCGEDRHQATILYAEGISGVPQQAENEGQIKRNARDQPKSAPLRWLPDAIYFLRKN